MKTDLRTELPLLIILGALFVAAAICWPQAPDRIPIHWNIHGEVDAYAGKLGGLLGLPLTALAIYGLMLVLPRLDPGYPNYSRFAGSYTTIRYAITLLLAGTYTIVLLQTFGVPLNVTMLMSLGVGALLVVLGNLMGKIRPNWFVGVRTPWTLSSKAAWVKTHRLAGWLFIAIGVLTALLGLLQPSWYVAALLSTIVAVSIYLVAYSYFVWKQDPHRIAPAGTTPNGDNGAAGEN